MSAIFGLLGCGTFQAPETRRLLAQVTGQPEEIAPRYATLIKSKAPALQIGFPDLGKGGGTLLLERREGAFEYWLSPEGAQVILQGGMLHGLHGFGEGLLASELTEPLALVRALHPGVSDRFQTFLDGGDRAVTRTYRCTIERIGPEDIALADRLVSTVLMVERCRSLDQSFENFYWVVPASGQIVLSRQWAGPFLGALSTRVVP
nr:YjbF family lipoprotein [Roseovarius sp. W115]